MNIMNKLTESQIEQTVDEAIEWYYKQIMDK